MIKKTSTYFKSVVFIAYLFLVTSFATSAQCRTVAKKQCFPQLSPYTQNGQFNSAKLAPGETAEVEMIFYAGQDYRLLVCAENVLGEVGYKVFDADKNELYNSKKAESNSWDFNVTSTQKLIIFVEVPALQNPNKIVPDGCVSILVGFKKK